MTIETESFQQLSAAAFESMVDEFRRVMGVDETWVYKEIPWTSTEVFNGILDAIGMDNMRFISSSQQTDCADSPYPRGTFHRGTFLISAKGRENLSSNSQALMEKLFPKI